ncbi:hypothetical protein F5Y03DRAFT_400693 [Xylaria venustula]|nr:hypothetical protein F5Y03DRAFT_400693 [Xylaria venustula]
MTRLLHLALISCFSLAPQVYSKWLIAKNNCAFEIYCAGAKNNGAFTPISKVLPGQSYQSTLAADNDNIGTVLKCGLDPPLLKPFQMELTVQYGKSWMDLSALDGDPFLPYQRYAEVDGGLCPIDCPPGVADPCEWPNGQQTCMTTGDATLYLCSKGP